MPAADWADDLFVRHPEAFLAIHEHAWPYGEEQARDLARVFGVFGGWEREPMNAERRKLIIVARPAARG